MWLASVTSSVLCLIHNVQFLAHNFYVHNVHCSKIHWLILVFWSMQQLFVFTSIELLFLPFVHTCIFVSIFIMLSASLLFRTLKLNIYWERLQFISGLSPWLFLLSYMQVGFEMINNKIIIIKWSIIRLSDYPPFTSTISFLDNACLLKLLHAKKGYQFLLGLLGCHFCFLSVGGSEGKIIESKLISAMVG